MLALYEDSKGNVWVGVKDGLWRWKPGPPKFYSLPGEPDGIRALGEDADGELLVGWKGRSIDSLTIKPKLFNSGTLRASSGLTSILRDRNGGLWIGTQDRGLVHVHQGSTDVLLLFRRPFGRRMFTLSLRIVKAIFGLAPLNGLDRFRDFAVTTFYCETRACRMPSSGPFWRTKMEAFGSTTMVD